MRSESDTDLCPQVLLVDLENCPASLAEIRFQIDDYQRILVCYAGPNEPRIPLSLATTLAKGIHDERLEFFAMKRGGKNAADFGIAFWAGRLMAEMPANTKFFIASADSGLDHVIDLLAGAGRRASRLPIKPIKRKPNGSRVMPYDEAAEVYYEAMILGQPNRPRRKASLLNSIKEYFIKQPALLPHEILNALVARQRVVIEDNLRVTYQATNDMARNHTCKQEARAPSAE